MENHRLTCCATAGCPPPYHDFGEGDAVARTSLTPLKTCLRRTTLEPGECSVTIGTPRPTHPAWKRLMANGGWNCHQTMSGLLRHCLPERVVQLHMVASIKRHQPWQETWVLSASIWPDPRCIICVFENVVDIYDYKKIADNAILINRGHHYTWLITTINHDQPLLSMMNQYQPSQWNSW